jgi:hypothetical protein
MNIGPSQGVGNNKPPKWAKPKPSCHTQGDRGDAVPVTVNVRLSAVRKMVAEARKTA